MKIVRVTPVENFFSITWMIGSRCNYDCMYCPSDIHDDYSTPHDLVTLQTAWKNIYEASKRCGMPYKINITGGEPTANRYLLPFIEWLKNHYRDVVMISVTTNGSASLRYYENLCSKIDSISFSTHSEHIDEQQFFAKVERLNSIMIPPQKSLHVNIMNEFWNQDRIKIYQQWLSDRGINHSVNDIDFSLRSRDHPIMQGSLNLAI